jgi:Protein of unknown function (DUF4238)
VIKRSNLKRNNHFLPECYQRGFTDPSEKVWVKFAEKTKLEHRNPSVGKRRSIYIRNENGVENDDLEDFFDKAVENPFACLSQTVKEEQNKLATITGTEQGVLCRFIASQAVRTLGHKQCIDQQAGHPVNKGTFISTMIRLMRIMVNAWLTNPPSLHFYTSLPHVGDQFITGDHPVLVIEMNDNPIWIPADNPRLGITDVKQILGNPRSRFWVSLSPYICISIQMQGGGSPHLPPEIVDPQVVRLFNNLIRGQCSLFTLAKDKESLRRL